MVVEVLVPLNQRKVVPPAYSRFLPLHKHFNIVKTDTELTCDVCENRAMQSYFSVV